MKYSKSAIGLLTAQYRSVLKKCWLINVGLFALGASMVAIPNEAEAKTYYYPGSTTEHYETGQGTGIICYNRTSGNFYYKYQATGCDNSTDDVVAIVGPAQENGGGDTSHQYDIAPWSTAIGRSATATNSSTVAVGNHAEAGGWAAIAVGVNNLASGHFSTSIGQNTLVSPNSTSGVAIGRNAIVGDYQRDADGNLVMIDNAYVELSGADGGVAVGVGAQATDDAGAAIGMNATASRNSIALGRDAYGAADGSFAMGHGAKALAKYSVAIGNKEDGTDGNMNSIALTASELTSAIQSASQAAADNINTHEQKTNWSAATSIELASDDQGAEKTTENPYERPTGSTLVKVVKEKVKIDDTKYRYNYYTIFKIGEKTYTRRYNSNSGNVSYYWGDNANYGEVIGSYYVEGAISNARGAIAIGNMAQAGYVDNSGVERGEYSLAMGYGAQTKGDRAISLGFDASANGDGSIAMGREALAQTESTIAMGYKANAEGIASLAFGYGAHTKDYATALGYNATATGKYSTAIGGADGNKATVSSITRLQEIRNALGSQADTNEAVVVIENADGTHTKYTVNTGVNETLNENGKSTPYTNLTTYSMETQIGINEDTGSIIYGTPTIQYYMASDKSFAADGNKNVVLSNPAQALGTYSIAIGNSSYASAPGTSALGFGATASGSNATALGYYSSAGGNYATALGYQAIASQNYSSALGIRAKATGISSTALGYTTSASGSYSVAAGVSASSWGTSSAAYGSNATSSGSKSTALGTFAYASGSYSVALGGGDQNAHNSASGSYSMALGYKTTASANNAVALGSNSVADTANTISVGSSSNQRRIVNVAKGSANSNDAVNISQLGTGLVRDANGVYNVEVDIPEGYTIKNGLQLDDDNNLSARLGQGLEFDTTATDGKRPIQVKLDGNTLSRSANGIKISTGGVTANELATDAVTSAKIKDGEVKTADIADLNVTTGKIANSAVTTDKIANNAVTTGKIADLNVTTGKIANSAVTTDKIADLNVTTGKIANNAVTKGKLETLVQNNLLDNATTGNGLTITKGTATKAANIALKLNGNTLEATADGLHVKDSGITTTQILDGTIVNADIANSTITSAKLADVSTTSTMNATTKVFAGSDTTIASTNTVAKSINDLIGRSTTWTGANTFKNNDGITIQNGAGSLSTKLTAATGNILNVSGGENVTGDLTVNTNKFKVTASNGNTDIAGTADIAGALKVGTADQFNVTNAGAVSTTSTLTADGESKFAKDASSVYTLDVTTSGATVADGKSFTANGNTTLGNAATDTLTVNATSTFNSDVSIKRGEHLNVGASGTGTASQFDINGTNYVTGIDSGTNTPTSSDNRMLATLKTVGATAAAILDGTNNFTNIQIDGKVYKTVDDGSSKYLAANGTSGANDTLATTKTVQETIKDLLSHSGGNIWTTDNTFNANVNIGDADADKLTVQSETTFKKSTTHSIVTDGQDVTMKKGNTVNVALHGDNGNMFSTGTTVIGATETGTAERLVENKDQIAFYNSANKETILIDASTNGVNGNGAIYVRNSSGQTMDQIDVDGMSVYNSTGSKKVAEITDGVGSDGKITLSHFVSTSANPIPMAILESTQNGGDLYLKNSAGGQGILLQSSSGTNTFNMYGGTGTSNEPKVLSATTSTSGGSLIMTNGADSGTAANQRVVVTSNGSKGEIDLKDAAGANQVVLNSTKGTTATGTNALQVINTQLAGRESGNSALNVNVNKDNNIITVGSNDHEDIFNVEAVMSLNGDVNIGNEDTDRLNVRSYTTFYQDKGETEKYYQTILDGQKLEMYAGTQDTAYDGSDAAANRRMALSQSDTGAVFDLLNSNGKDGVHLGTVSGVSDFNMYTGNTAAASNQAISMHASPTTTAGVNNGTSLVMTNGGAKTAENTKFEIYNDATGSKVLMGNSTGADTIQIYSSDPNSSNNGKIIVNEIVSGTVTPVVTMDSTGLTIANANTADNTGKKFTLGTVDLASDTPAANIGKRDQFIFNGRMADTFSASDSIFYNGKYGDHQTIASTKSVADALGTLSGTNYLIDTYFGNPAAGGGSVNTVAANLKRIDAKIDTWTDQYHNIRKSTTIDRSAAIDDATDKADSFDANQTIGDTFEAIDKAIGTVKNGSYVKTYDGSDDKTSIAGNINNLDTQLYLTDYGMQQNTANLAQLRSEVGYKSGLNLTNKNLTYGSTTAPANIVTAINNLSFTVGKIHGLVNTDGTVNSGSSTVGDRTNLNSQTKTVSDQLVALDNAIDAAKTRITTNEGNIGNMNFANTHYIYNDGDLSSAARTLDGKVYENEQNIININDTINNLDVDLTHIKNGMGGSFTGEGGAWTATASTYWNTINNATSLMQAIDNVSNTIGTAEQLNGAGNGVNAFNTVNENLKAVSGAVTTEKNRAIGVEGLLENLTGRAKDKENLVEAINALDGAITDISGDIIHIGDDFGDLNDLTHNAFKPKSSEETFTKATNRAVTNIANGMGGEFDTDGKWSGTASTYLGDKNVTTLIGAVQHVSDAIGTAAELADAGNGISATNTVNANLKALSGSLTSESNRAKTKENEIAGNLTAEISRAQGAEAQLSTDIATERTRATGVEGVIGNLTGHALGSTNLVDAVNAVDGALNSEINRATAAESALDTKIGEEKARAEGVEAGLSTAITNEVTRATAAEGNLTFQMANGNFNQTTTKTLTDAVNALDTSIGSRADLTHNAISDTSTLAKAINSLAVNVGTGMGGTFNAETGAWSGSVNTYMSESPYQFTSVMGAVQHISDTIGTKAHLGYATGVTPKNGLSYENTVNQNLAALNSAIGDVHSFSEEAGYTNKAKNATDVVDAITKIDNYVSNMSDSVGDLSALQHPAFGTITSSTTLTQATNTAVTNLATGMGGTFAPVTGVWSGSIQTYRDPSAVGVTSIMDAVDHVVNTIGTAADLGHTATTTPANGVSSSNTVNKNIGIINSKLGNVANFAGDTYTGAAKGATTAVEAITKIDTALSGEITRATTTEGKLEELEGPAAGKTNLVAAINAVNGSVTNLGDIINTQSVDLTHIKNGMGGSFTGEGGAWRATASTYWNTIDNATSLMQAIDNVSNTIGTAAQLNNAGNGVNANNTVNQNLKAVSSALTTEKGRAIDKENEIAGNLTAEITRATTAEGNLNTAITTVDGRVTTLNNTVTNLSTKVTNMGVGMGGTLSDTGVWSGTVQTYRDSEPKAVSSLMGAVNHVINTIGTASELGTANGVSASNTVNKNIGAVSGALTNEINRASAVEGNLDELTVTIPSGVTKNLVNAINAVNGSVTNLSNTISGQETDLTHIKIGMGGSFDQDTGVWSAQASTYYDTIQASSIMQAVDNVSNTIGTAEQLNGAGNNVSAFKTVNENLKAVSSALTTEKNRAITVEGDLGDLTGKAAGKTSLVAAINAIDGAVTNIEGDVNTLNNNYSQLNSTVTDLSNSYNTLNNTVNILDGEVGDLTDLKHNAISDKSTITKAVNSLAVNVHQGMGGVFAGDGTWSATVGVTNTPSYGAINSASSITGALTQINSNIGTAADLGTSPLKNGISTTNSVNSNIRMLNSAIGDLSRFTADDYGGTVAKNSTNLMSAVESIDSAIKDLMATSSGDLSELIAKINNEITNRTDGDNILNEYISNVDERVGNLADLTHNAISDKSTITKAVNSLAVNVNRGMGGTFDENGKWGGTVKKDGTKRYGDFNTESIIDAMTDLSSTIGTEADLGYDAEHPEIVPANGVSKTNSVNKNIAALNTAITNIEGNVVHKTGDEGVAGVKTFSDNLVANGGITTTTLTASGLAKLSGGDTGGLQFDNGQVAKSISTTIGNGSDTALATTSAVKNYVGAGVLSVKMNGTVNSTTFGANDSENALIDLGAIVTNVAEGTTNGTISVTQNGATGDVKVHGLGSAAYTDVNNYATSEQGAKADSALQGVKVNNSLLTVATDKTVNITIAEGDTDGSIKVNGTDIDVHGLKGGAYKDVDTEVIASSANLITSGAVSTALSGKLDTSVFNARTVNGRALATDIELIGTDIKLTGYSKPAGTSAIEATDSVSAAIGKLEAGLDGKYDKTGGELGGNMWFASGKGIKYGDITVTDLATAISNNPVNTKFVTEKAVSDYVGTGDLKLTINGVQKTAFNANADDDLTIDLGSYVTQQQPDSAKGKVLTVNATTGMVEATQIANTMLTDNSITKNKFVTEVQNSLTAADSALQGVKINGTALPKSTTDKTVNIEAVVHGSEIAAKGGTAEEPVYINDGKLATSQAVREYVSDFDSNVVHKTGAETVGGVKTFSDNIVANGGIGTTTLTASGLTTLSGGDTGGLQFGNGQIVKSISTTIGNGSNEALATTSAVKSYVGDKNLTIKVNNTSVGVFNANESTADKEINIDLSAYQTSNIGTDAADKNKVVITNNDGNITTSTVTTEELNLLSTAVDTKAGVTDANAGKLIKVGAIKAYVDEGLDTKYDKTGGLLSGDMWFAENKGIKYGDITVTGLATSISSSPVDTKFVTEKAVSDYVGKGDLKLTINGVEKTAFNANTNADLAIDLGSYVTQQQSDSAKGKVLTVNETTGMVEATQIANSMIVDESITKNKFVTSVQNSLDAADSALQGVKINGTALTKSTTDKTVNIEAVVNGTDITAHTGPDTQPVYTNDDKLTTSKAVREYVTGMDENVVHKTGTETVNGVKTFGDNIVANGGVTATTVTASSDVTAGGLVISNGSGQDAYTSQTINRIDNSTSATAPLTSGSNTTMATTNTVFNTVGNLTSSEMTSGIFAGSTNTVVGKLSALKDAIHDAGGDITDLVAKFYNITSGSDKFDGNEWKANVSTYLETREVNNILGAVDVVSDTIGTVTDLGYASEEATGDLANGISRNNTVNKNISALNTALSNAQTTIEAIEGDYVTKRELHGKAGAGDTVNVGENAANINIGAATAGITIDTTNNHKTVDIAGDTITLDSQVVINKADRSTTFGNNGTTVQIKDGGITATGNTTTAGLVIKNGSDEGAYTSQTINRVDNSTTALTSGSNTTMATTATVFNTVGNISGLNSGTFENSANTVAGKLTALDTFIGDKSAFGNDASNGISDKTKVTNAISSLATHVGQGLGGSFDATSGAWSGSIQTYRDTAAYSASSVMDAISHVSSYAIGSATDLGYSDTDPSVTPANGISKDKSVNSNLAALNTALSTAQTTIEAIEGDYVTKKELHGKDGVSGDIVNVGEYADTINIGAADTGIKVDTTSGHKSVEITGTTISLGDNVTVTDASTSITNALNASGGISTTTLTTSGLTTLNGGDNGGLRFDNGQVVKSISTTIGNGSDTALATTSAVKTYVDDGLDTKYDKTGGLLSGDMWFATGKGIKYGDITVTGLATSISSNPVNTKFVTEKAVSDYVGKGDLKLTINGVEKTAFNANTNTDLAIDLGSYVTQQQPDSAKGKVLTVNAETGMVEATQIANSMIVDESITKNKFVTSVQNSLDAADSALQGVKINGTALTKADDNTVNIEAVVNGTDITYNSGTAEEPVYDNDGKLATSKAVREYVTGIDANVVHKTGAETINGVKTFGDNIVANGGVTATTVTTSGAITSGGLITANDGVLIKDGESLTMNGTELTTVLKGDATLTNADDAIATSKVIKNAITTSETETKAWVKGDEGAQTANFTATGTADDNVLVGTERNIKEAINYLGTQTYDLKQTLEGDYVTKVELHGKNGQAGDIVNVGEYADTINVGAADAGIKVDTTDGNKKVDVTGNTINLGSKVTVNGQTGETTFGGSGTNSVNINNGAITATGNTTTGGLVIKNGSGDTAYTSQTIDRIDNSTTALTSGSTTTMATTATVFNTVGDVTSLNSGTFAGSDDTVVGKLTALDNAVDDANTEITYIKNSTGGEYNPDTGVWSATATTYKGSITAHTMMQAVNHVSNTIGSVTDLGYASETATGDLANGISRNNTVNQNIAVLNSAIGDLDDLTVDTGTGDKNIVKAINKVNNIVNNEGAKITNITAGGTFDENNNWSADVSTYKETRTVHSILEAVDVVSDTIGTAAELANAGNGVSATNTVNANINALSGALTEAKQAIEGYVTKEELYGKDGVTGDEVKVGNYADKVTIGTEDAGIVINNTEGNKTVQITGDTINLGDQVSIQDGTVTAAGIELGGNTVDSIDTGETPITSETASKTTLATTATVLATASTAATEAIKDTFGGELDEDGKWSAQADTYYSQIKATKFMEAVDNVSNTIGTAKDLGAAKNGVSAKKTVNANIAAINGSLGKINGLVAKDGSVNSTSVTSTVGTESNLKGGKTVEDYLVSLDNAVGNRNYASTNVVKAGSSAAEAISALDKSLGSAADLGEKPANGVDAGNSVNANIAAMNSALGDVAKLKNTYWVSEATNVTDAVVSLDEQLHNMGVAVNDIAYRMDDMRKEMRDGLASAAALSALVPNARSTGKTSLSVGTGGYKGRNAVAVGGFHYFTDNLLMNVGASWGKNHDMMYRVGMTYTF